ncbi:MAG: hypothetical protein PVSMB7_18260 [Chloroflexota bacterium]
MIVCPEYFLDAPAKAGGGAVTQLFASACLACAMLPDVNGTSDAEISKAAAVKPETFVITPP